MLYFNKKNLQNLYNFDEISNKKSSIYTETYIFDTYIFGTCRYIYY